MGVFAVDRGVFDHPFFAAEPYSEREAWIWLVGCAVWKTSRVRVKDTMFSLERGQCAFSLRFMAEKWKWSKDKVARFLKRLKTETMIETQARRDATIITICNYNEYQLTPGHKRDADQDTKCDAGETQARRRRDKEEELNKRKGEDAPKQAPLFAPDPPTDEAEYFTRGKKVLGPDAGGLLVRLLNSKKKNVALARAAIEQASTKGDPREYIGRILAGPAAANERHGINDPLAGIQ